MDKNNLTDVLKGVKTSIVKAAEECLNTAKNTYVTKDSLSDINNIRAGATAGMNAIPMPSGGEVGNVLKKTQRGTEWSSDDGLLITKEIGKDWTAITLPALDTENLTNPRWTDICYGFDGFIAVANFDGEDERLPPYVSRDGVTWNQADFTIEGKKAIACGSIKNSNYYYFLGNSYLYAYAKNGWNYSVCLPGYWDDEDEWHDGITWNDICVGNGKVVIVGDNYVSFATQGDLSDLHEAIPLQGNWKSVCYGKNKFVAVGSGAVAYSTDGMNWIKPEYTGFFYYASDSICYGNGKFVAIGGTNVIQYSNDGIYWNYVSLPDDIPSYLNGRWSSVCYYNGMFIATNKGISFAKADFVICSYDGITWEKCDMPQEASWIAACGGNNKIIALSETTDHTSAEDEGSSVAALSMTCIMQGNNNTADVFSKLNSNENKHDSIQMVVTYEDGTEETYNILMAGDE